MTDGTGHNEHIRQSGGSGRVGHDPSVKDQTYIRVVALSERRLPVVIRREDDGRRVATCLPLGIRATGARASQALRALADAVDEYLDACERAGRDPYHASGTRALSTEPTWADLCGLPLRPPDPKDPDWRVMVGLLRVGDRFAWTVEDRVMLLGQA